MVIFHSYVSLPEGTLHDVLALAMEHQFKTHKQRVLRVLNFKIGFSRQHFPVSPFSGLGEHLDESAKVVGPLWVHKKKPRQGHATRKKI
jgi:hypothetical protein